MRGSNVILTLAFFGLVSVALFRKPLEDFPAYSREDFALWGQKKANGDTVGYFIGRPDFKDRRAAWSSTERFEADELVEAIARVDTLQANFDLQKQNIEDALRGPSADDDPLDRPTLNSTGAGGNDTPSGLPSSGFFDVMTGGGSTWG